MATSCVVAHTDRGAATRRCGVAGLGMAFGQSSGPPATGQQLRELLELLAAAGHDRFPRRARPDGFHAASGRREVHTRRGRRVHRATPVRGLRRRPARGRADAGFSTEVEDRAPATVRRAVDGEPTSDRSRRGAGRSSRRRTPATRLGRARTLTGRADPRTVRRQTPMPLRVSRIRVGFGIGANPEPTGKNPATSANTSIVE